MKKWEIVLIVVSAILAFTALGISLWLNWHWHQEDKEWEANQAQCQFKYESAEWVILVDDAS